MKLRQKWTQKSSLIQDFSKATVSDCQCRFYFVWVEMSSYIFERDIFRERMSWLMHTFLSSLVTSESMSCNNSTVPEATPQFSEDLLENDTNPLSTVVGGQRRTSFEERVFQYCVIVIGIIGTFANGTVITVFVSQSRKIKITTPHKFILNQLALDLLSCICLVLVYGWKIIETDLRFTWNFLSCVFVASESLIWLPVSASIANLILITLERYFKIVHTPLYKKYYHNWMTYFLILISWIVGSLITFPPDVVSVDYSNGICEYFVKWPNPYDGLFFSSAVFCMNYANPMLIFIFCYSTHSACDEEQRQLLRQR